MKLKICGLTDRKNIEQILPMNPDFVGFIFFPKSPRYMGNILEANYVKSITDIPKCGVFVNEEMQTVLQNISKYKLDYAQLHGNESQEYCKSLSQYCKVIKVFHVTENLNESFINEFNSVSLFLFETPTSNYGGSGNCFDHTLLNKLKISKPFLISGGIHHSNFDPIKIYNNQFLGIDVNSKYEISPGIKDIQELKELKNKIKNNYETR